MNDPTFVQEASSNANRALGADAQAAYDKALDLLDQGRAEDAVISLREAVRLAPDHARSRSMLGVAVAGTKGGFEEGRNLCESAARQEFFNPDLYANLAQIYLRVGRRAEALRYLRRGQMIDPGHAGISAAIGQLGKRRMPVVPFLPRRHPVNRALGTARNLVLTGLASH
ncbi:MAG: tetratricopeptide repeat protein [Myxococcota bacterium]